jgi:archaellum component FlaC
MDSKILPIMCWNFFILKTLIDHKILVTKILQKLKENEDSVKENLLSIQG